MQERKRSDRELKIYPDPIIWYLVCLRSPTKQILPGEPSEAEKVFLIVA